MSVLTDLLSRGAEPILLCEIDVPGLGTLYLSDSPHATEPTDTPPSVAYQAVLAGLPRLHREIAALRGGRSPASYGALELATQTVWAPWSGADVDLLTVPLRGAACRLYLTAPRAVATPDVREELWTGYLGTAAGTWGGAIAYTLTDPAARAESRAVSLAQFDAGAECASVPDGLDGAPRPLALGRGGVTNVAPVLVCTADLTYEVAGGPYAVGVEVEAVYDNGVAVAWTAGADGRFSLSAAPAGRVTCDVTGWHPAYLAGDGVADLVHLLLREWGGVASGALDVQPSGTGTAYAAGWYLTAAAIVGELVSAICAGEGWWWGPTREGRVTVRTLPGLPTPGTYGAARTLVPEEVLGDVAWEEETDVVWAVEVTGARNWTPQEPAAGVALDRAAYLRTEGRRVRLERAAVLADYPGAGGAEVIASARRHVVPAAVGEAYLDRHGSPRRRVTLTVPLWRLLDLGWCPLGETLVLSGFGGLDGYYVLVALTESSGASGLEATAVLWGEP